MPLPVDTCVAAGRDKLVARCATDYLLVLDDDQSVADDSSIEGRKFDDDCDRHVGPETSRPGPPSRFSRVVSDIRRPFRNAA